MLARKGGSRMQCLINVLCSILLPAVVSLPGQAQNNEKKPRFFRVPSMIVLPVVAHQADCPIEFVKASILNHIGGGGVEVFQIRNRGTRPIRAYTVATVTSVGSGGKW